MLMARGPSGVGSPEITDSERRHADVVKFGRVAQADYAKAAVRVTIGDEDDPDGHLVTGWLPMAGGRAKGDSDWHPLEVGERVMVLSESGELQNGMVLPAALYSDEDPAPGNKAGLWRKRFQNGAEISYDRDSGSMMLDATGAGTVTLKAGGCLLVLADGVITIKADEIVTDGVTRLNKGTRGIVFRGSRDSDGDTNVEGADNVFV
jgi:phage baseplate assembly protein V